MTVDHVEWASRMVLGGRLPQLEGTPAFPAVFSADGKHQIVVFTHQIRVYFLATRQCVRCIDINIGLIVDMCLDPGSASQILLFSNLGGVFSVNWKEKVASPVTEVFVMSPPQGYVLASASCYGDRFVGVFQSTKKKGPSTALVQTFLKENEGETKVVVDDVTPVFSWSFDKSQVVFVTTSHEVVRVSVSGDSEMSVERNSFVYKSPVTSVAVSNDGVVALGTGAGPIQLIYVGGSDQRLLKWHIDLVKTVAFSPDNKYLLSGGLEKVLVLWHLDSDNHQFLPRLNGTIDKIHIDVHKTDCYSMLLGCSDGIHHEMLTILAVDLVSRLTVNSARPRLVPGVAHSLRRAYKKLGNHDNLYQVPIRQDYSLPAAVHPTTNQVYFPSGASIQIYDWVRQEQQSLLNAAAVLPTGKVRSETKLVDPKISLVDFSNDGSWMVTVDTVTPSPVDNLLSKSDEYHALKFWKNVDSKNDGSKWELACKIIDPHGHGNKIFTIKPAPLLKNELAFVSADDKGGVRIWRVVKNLSNSNQQTAWTLHKSSPGGIASSSAVDVCWSQDSSVVFLAHETSVTVLDGYKLTTLNHISGIADSPIRAINVLENHLLVVSQTRIASYDLIRGAFSFIMRANFPEGARNLVAIDYDSRLICVAANYYEKSTNTLAIKSKLLVFNHNNLEPVFTKNHNQGITSVLCVSGSFLFVDLDARVGMLTSSLTEYLELNEDIKPDVNQIMIKAEERAQQEIAHNNDRKTFDMNTFASAFENAHSLTLDSLFDRVVSITGR